MGQKVNPHGLRVGVIKDWESRWFADDENFSDNLVEDYKIREFLKKKLYHAGISKIEIERTSDRVKVLVYTAKPGVVIGKGGAEIEKLKAELAKFSTKKVLVDIKEVKVRYKIDTHDYEVRLKNIRKFISQGNKVKIVVMLRGREMQHSSLAIELANRFIADLANDPVTVEKKPMVEGRNVTAWLAPQ